MSIATFEPTFSEDHARILVEATSKRLSEETDHAYWMAEAVTRNAATAAELRRTGPASLGGFYPAASIRRLGARVDECVARVENLGRIRNHRMELEEGLQLGDFRYIDPTAVTGENDIADNSTNVHVRDPLAVLDGLAEIILDERLLARATAYHGCIPQLTYVKVFKSFVNDLEELDTQVFHADFGSYWILKAIIYLNDVESDGGPFTYVRTSHLRRYEPGFDNSALRLRYSDDEMREWYGESDIVECTARAGDVVLAETTGFHKSKKPTKAARKAIIANYCVHPEMGFDYVPIKIPATVHAGLSPLQKAVVRHLELT